MIRPVVVACVVVVALATAGPAKALGAGDHCTLKSELPITIRHAGGSVQSTLESGADVEVVSLGDGGTARVYSGELKGTVSFSDLESACSGSLRICTLHKAATMYEQNRSDSRSWKLKIGAEVSVLKKGKTWAAVRVSDLQGFVKTDEIDSSCGSHGDVVTSGGDDGDKPTEASAEAVERGEGPGLLLLPFHLEGAAPAGAGDAFLEMLFERASFYRPDAARLGTFGTPDQPWKEQIFAAAKRARAADTAYVLAGRLSVEAPNKDAPLEERYLLQLAIIDAKSGKVLKGVRVRPTTKADDPWAEKTLAELLPSLSAAPGSRLPAPSESKKLELPQQPAQHATPEAPHASAAPAAPDAPWFANGWGYAVIGSAVVAGAGSGVAGVLARDENTRANVAVQTDPTRADHRNTALAEAITADSLGVVAAGVAVAGVIVFASRAGLD